MTDFSSLQTLADNLGDGEGGPADDGTVVEGGGRRQGDVGGENPAEKQISHKEDEGSILEMTGTGAGSSSADARLSFVEARDSDSEVDFNFEEFLRLANRVVDDDKDSMVALNNLKIRWESKFERGALEQQQAAPLIRKAWCCLLMATTDLLA
ncbi:UNVERIFIED_CONTAM: hypothetical protein Sindi_0428800 [Sesamum indicum]